MDYVKVHGHMWPYRVHQANIIVASGVILMFSLIDFHCTVKWNVENWMSRTLGVQCYEVSVHGYSRSDEANKSQLPSFSQTVARQQAGNKLHPWLHAVWLSTGWKVHMFGPEKAVIFRVRRQNVCSQSSTRWANDPLPQLLSCYSMWVPTQFHLVGAKQCVVWLCWWVCITTGMLAVTHCADKSHLKRENSLAAQPWRIRLWWRCFRHDMSEGLRSQLRQSFGALHHSYQK